MLVPPGEPVQVSPPQDGNNDGGDTVPFPIDDEPIEPDPLCGNFEVIYEINNPQPDGSPSIFQNTITLPGNCYASFATPFVPGQGATGVLVGSGVVNEQCVNDVEYVVFNGGREGTTITLISSVPL
jgi:hypothetical protein